MKASVPKPKYRRDPQQPVPKRWGRIWDAVACSGLNKTEIYKLIHEGIIESFIYKFRPDAKSGSRMINLESLTAHMDRRAAEAKAAEESKK
jgi:hypothetical protein